MRELFTVDNISYQFTAINNSITFSIRRGASKLAIYPIVESYRFFDDKSFDDLNICLSPFKVFEKVVELSLKWIRQEQPYIITFGTSSDRKGKVYDYLVDKTLKNNPDVHGKYFYNKSKSGDYVFYRKYTMPIAA